MLRGPGGKAVGGGKRHPTTKVNLQGAPAAPNLACIETDSSVKSTHGFFFVPSMEVSAARSGALATELGESLRAQCWQLWSSSQGHFGEGCRAEKLLSFAWRQHRQLAADAQLQLLSSSEHVVQWCSRRHICCPLLPAAFERRKKSPAADPFYSFE